MSELEELRSRILEERGDSYSESAPHVSKNAHWSNALNWVLREIDRIEEADAE